ncbi:MAG: hypothetical protein R3C05_02510 [Pirellulaceae bacterium]
MKRIKSMWRETKLLWIGLLVVGIVLPFVDAMLFGIWLINLPICVAVFLYFAYVRYDDDGNDLGG